jgi:hypothetical protein
MYTTTNVFSDAKKYHLCVEEEKSEGLSLMSQTFERRKISYPLDEPTKHPRLNYFFVFVPTNGT